MEKIDPEQAEINALIFKFQDMMKSFDIDVLTIDAREIGYAMDYSLENYVKTNFGKIHLVTPPAWIKKRTFKILRYIPGFPDRFRFFNKQMFKKAVEIDVANYDLIVSWSQWHSIHMVASKIKNNFPSIRWLAHLSDPWSDNPFLTRIIGYKASQYYLEKSVIKDQMTCASEFIMICSVI